jgi:hypothetical protein
MWRCKHKMRKQPPRVSLTLGMNSSQEVLLYWKRLDAFSINSSNSSRVEVNATGGCQKVNLGNRGRPFGITYGFG